MPTWILKFRGWLTKVTDFFVALRAAGIASKDAGPDVGGNKDIKPR